MNGSDNTEEYIVGGGKAAGPERIDRGKAGKEKDGLGNKIL